jgi:hypothetical protein
MQAGTRPHSMINRIPIILSAYLAACVIATLAVSVLFALGLLKYSGPPAVSFATFSLAAGLAVLLGVYVAIAALLPSVLAISYAEYARVRHIALYGAGGALVGIAAYGLYALVMILAAGTAEGFIPAGHFGSFAAAVTALFGGPGLIGGVVYWLIAGRSAGG